MRKVIKKKKKLKRKADIHSLVASERKYLLLFESRKKNVKIRG